MEDMVAETFDMIDDDEELEEEADAEVDAVLFNITEGKLGKAGTVTAELPVSLVSSWHFPSVLNESDSLKATEAPEDEAETEAAMARMQEQLHGLLNS